MEVWECCRAENVTKAPRLPSGITCLHVGILSCRYKKQTHVLPQIDAGNGRVEIHDMAKMLGLSSGSHVRTSLERREIHCLSELNFE